jgi:hypothetical protein
MLRVWTVFFHLRLRYNDGLFGHANENFGSMKSGEITDDVSDYLSEARLALWILMQTNKSLKYF